MSNVTRQNRITTNPGSFFVQCLALPVRDEPLEEEDMRRLKGGRTGGGGGRGGGGRGYDTSRNNAVDVSRATGTNYQTANPQKQAEEIVALQAFGAAAAQIDSSVAAENRQSWDRVVSAPNRALNGALDWVGDRVSEAWNFMYTGMSVYGRRS